MDNGLPSNFGAPAHFCDFNPAWPNQLWDPSRPTDSYRGVLYEQGGSLPESGKGPFSNVTSPFASGDANGSFWGSSMGPQVPQQQRGG